eukprot:1940407-Prymnesium_polylepis.1
MRGGLRRLELHGSGVLRCPPLAAWELASPSPKCCRVRPLWARLWPRAPGACRGLCLLVPTSSSVGGPVGTRCIPWPCAVVRMGT